jgi:hypothetical protein
VKGLVGELISNVINWLNLYDKIILLLVLNVSLYVRKHLRMFCKGRGVYGVLQLKFPLSLYASSSQTSSKETPFLKSPK